MARTYTPQDAHTILTTIAKQVTGQENISVTNTSDFVSVGETVLNHGIENVMNALGMVMGKLYVDADLYEGDFKTITRNGDVFTPIYREVAFYSKNPLPAGNVNTQLFTNLAGGFDNGENADTNGDPRSTRDQWEQNPQIPIQINYGGSSVWQDCLTRYEYQLEQAFRNEQEFNTFWSGAYTEKMNDIAQQMDAFARMAVLNMMGNLYDNNNAINLTAEFNTANKTTYTTDQLCTTYFKEFLAFFVSYIKKLSNNFAKRDNRYFTVPPKDGYSVLRFVPKERQHLMLYRPFFIDAETQVLPEIFHDGYLDIGNYEGIDFWQSINDPMAINVTPAVPGANGLQTAGTAVSLSNVLGLMFDERAVMVNYELDKVTTTQLEARKHYVNTWFTYMRNAINNTSRKAVLLYMADA